MKLDLINGDCMVESERIESGTIDLILTDLPYGTMEKLNYKEQVKCRGIDSFKWDKVIDSSKIMDVANRLLRKNGKMVLFAQQPFTTELINSAGPNLPFGYCMIWEKDNYGLALLANKAPLNYYEDILVFSKNSGSVPAYDYEGEHPLRGYFKKVLNYIGLNKKQIIAQVGQRADHTLRINSTQYSLCTEATYLELISTFKIDKMSGFTHFPELKEIDIAFKQTQEEERLRYLRSHNEQYPSIFNLWEGGKHKSNILKYKKDYTGHHPTQKPVLLLEDLIKTFSNEGDLVLDLTMGSGSTGVACKSTGRNFIGIELDEDYFKAAQERIHEQTRQQELF